MRAYRHVALVLITLLGVALIIFPLAAGLPKKTQAVDDLTNDFRPAFTKSAIAESRTDLATMNAMLTQLQKETLPALAAKRGLSEEQFRTLLGAQFPAVGKGLSEVNTIMPRFNVLAGTMDEQASNFRDADAIPTSHQPNTAVTYLYLIPGVLLLVLGGAGLALSLTGAKPLLTMVCVGLSALIGLVMVVGTFATGVIGKTKSAEDMFTAFRPTFTESQYKRARTDLDVLAAMAVEMQTKAIPTLAKLDGTDEGQYKAHLAQQFPAVGKGLVETDRILKKFDGLIENIGTNLNTFKDADSIPDKSTAVSVMPWLLFGPGLAVFLLADVALVLHIAGRRGSRPGAGNGAAPAAA